MDSYTLLTWLVIILAVLLFGIAKGGFMGSFGMISVPLMSLVIPPSQATAILLPLLVCADIVNVSIWYKYVPKKQIIPLCIFGTIGVIGAVLLVGRINEDIFRFLIGVISILFALYGLFYKKKIEHLPKGSRGVAAATSGFTSYLAHAGGPPFIIWVFSQKFTPTQIQALSAAFFAYINFIKVPGYMVNGFFAKDTLLVSLYILPFAPIGVLLGRYLHHRVKGKIFFYIVYASLLLTGIKLCL
ncbi:MAG: sulfite exporter TauE/SafE family protein [Alphaproteobacteria bacterium]